MLAANKETTESRVPSG